MENHFKLVNRLVEYCPDLLNATNPYFGAVEKGCVEVVELFLKLSGRLLEAKDSNGRTALMVSVILENTSLLSLLIHKGAALDSFDTDENSALMLAIKNKRLQSVQLLLRAATERKLESSFRFLTGKSADVIRLNHFERTGNSPLLQCVSNNELDMAKWLIAAGAKVNLRKSKDAMSTLMTACTCGHKDMTELLLRSGARVDETNSEVRAACHLLYTRIQ